MGLGMGLEGDVYAQNDSALSKNATAVSLPLNSFADDQTPRLENKDQVQIAAEISAVDSSLNLPLLKTSSENEDFWQNVVAKKSAANDVANQDEMSSAASSNPVFLADQAVLASPTTQAVSEDVGAFFESPLTDNSTQDRSDLFLASKKTSPFIDRPEAWLVPSVQTPGSETKTDVQNAMLSESQSISLQETTESNQIEPSQTELDVNDIQLFTNTNQTIGGSVEEMDALSANSTQTQKRTLRSFQTMPEEYSELEEDFPCEILYRQDWTQECLTALEPYFRLFREYPDTSEWIGVNESLITEILASLDNEPNTALQKIEKLKEQLLFVDVFKNMLINSDKKRTQAQNSWQRSFPKTSQSVLQRNMIRSVSVEMPQKAKKNGEAAELGLSVQEIGVFPESSASSESTPRLNLSSEAVPSSAGISETTEKLASPDVENSDEANRQEAPELLRRYQLAQRLELLDSMRHALERRVYLWTLAARYYVEKNQNQLKSNPMLTLEKIVQLQSQTKKVQNYFGVSPTGQKWRDGFEIDLLYSDLERMELLWAETLPQSGSSKQDASRTNASVALERSTQVVDGTEEPLREYQQQEEQQRAESTFLFDRINSICFKMTMTSMTPEQKDVFNREPLAAWMTTLQSLACDQTDAAEFLWLFERYEQTAGGEIGSQLSRQAYRMKTSPSKVCRDFGAGIDVIYDNPNTKVYISELLINRLLPIRDPEFDVVQETILNNPVAGRRRTDTEVLIKLIPDKERLLMNLNIHGKIIAATSSVVFPATLYNESYAMYFGQKQIEWRDNGIVASPCSVNVRNNNQLSGVQTEIDFVPLIGDLTREVVRGQYESKQQDIVQETRQRIIREAKIRIDQEANERFQETNHRLQTQFFSLLNRLDLSLRMQNSKTTDDWLLASLRLASPGSLGSQTAEPKTLAGAFADFKVHESTLNTVLNQLELSGKSFTVEELLAHLSEKLNRPELKQIKVENADLVLGMNENDPVTVRFFEDRIRLRLHLDYVALGNKSWEDVQVTVYYRPQKDSVGQTVLVRDGLIELTGPLSIRAQFPLRSIFSKVFPLESNVVLRPKLFDNDERFVGLTTGLCRVTRGWFAISVVLPGTNALKSR